MIMHWRNCNKLWTLTACPESSHTLHVLQSIHCQGDLAARHANSSVKKLQDG